MMNLLERLTYEFPCTLGVLAAFVLGCVEARLGVGMAWEDPPGPRTKAYEFGQDLFR